MNLASAVLCMTIYASSSGMNEQHCGTIDQLTYQAKVTCARYDALPDQNTRYAIYLGSKCQEARQVVNNLFVYVQGLELDRQRVYDAHRRLRDLGAE